jgi:hypothetical protein
MVMVAVVVDVVTSLSRSRSRREGMTRSAGEVPKHGPSTTGRVRNNRFQLPWLQQLTYTATVQVESASQVAGRGLIYCCTARYSELEIYLGGV